MCLFPEENQQPVLRSHRFSEEKWQISLGVKQKHTFYRRKSTKKIGRVSPFINNYAFRIISPFNKHNNNNSVAILAQVASITWPLFSVGLGLVSVVLDPRLQRRKKYEASSGKDLARALAKLSPGGMSEFVQSVPVNVAGFLMRSPAQSAPLRLWPTECDTQDDVSNRGGPAAIEACG